MTASTFTRRLPRTALALAATGTLALVLSACANDPAPAESPSMNNGPANTAAAPNPETSAPNGGATLGNESTDGYRITVTPTTADGVTVLRVDGDQGDDGGDRDVTGELITGPGGCIALNEGGNTVLLAFDDDDTHLATDRPGVIDDDNDPAAYVGDQVTLEINEVPLANITGAPAECLEGVGDIAYEVDDITR